eukprot:gene10316-12660_t
MVLTSDTRFSEIYDLIKNDSLHGISVLILVAKDCDSIAACKILTEILKSDLISYTIKPVSGIDDLVEENTKLEGNDEVNENSYYGKSAASMMYKLSSILLKENLDGLLWYGILGITDQLIHERISLENYELEYREFKDIVHNIYPKEEEDDTVGTGFEIVGEKINPVDDYRFMLYRHWNLYDSLYNSSYVACKLKLWKANGRYLLDTLFAMMGIPLEQTKQKYVSMNSIYKNNFKNLLEINAPKFGLNDLYFHSFSKKYECKTEISASDTVYAVTALLESDNLEADISDEEIWRQNFWEAYYSISNKNIESLKIGLQQSIELQKEITRQVASMIEKRSVILSGPFRYAFIRENSDLRFFIHPLALTKLGLYMMDAFISMGKPSKPFLIGALNEKKKTYLIVGISGSHNSEFQSNEFGDGFRKAAELTNATLKYQSFDTSVVEITDLDMPKFVEQLHGNLI